jgi:DNA mismatch repair protein MutS
LSKFTPLMEQYHRIRKEYPDTLLFFRLGDFYEMFGDDAKLGSKVLEIALTSRQKVPMCGVPYHAASKYIATLIKAGYKVAICEQLEDAKVAKDLVKRDVIRIITPGTVLEENLLPEKSNNFLAFIYLERPNVKRAGLSFVDISTGEFLATELEGEDILEEVSLELTRLPVAEVLLPKEEESNAELLNLLKKYSLPVNYVDDWNFMKENAYQKLLNQFQLHSLKGLGLENKDLAIGASGAITSYLEATQKMALSHLLRLKFYSKSEFMVLDESTKTNLELLANVQDNTKQGSLLGVLDLTQTAMGGRRLRQYILEALTDVERIKARQEGVEDFISNSIKRGKARELLKKIFDLERLISRLCCGTANARDLVSLKNSLELIPKIKELIGEFKSEMLRELSRELHDLKEIVDLIESAIVPEPPPTLKEGGIINPEYNEELNNLYQMARGGKEWVAELEAKERKRTGINSLKVGYTSVFGYYIEVTRANLKQVPPDYVRKQTLVNAERFVTPELKEKETLILGAEERKVELEYEIFQKVRNRVISEARKIQEVARAIAEIDVLSSLAEVAANSNYTKPTLNNGEIISIKAGRHPVVEKMLIGEKFVPNDTYLDGSENQILIITGPNMAGKSTYIRQVALIVLLAQMGSFVPAEEATIGIVDRIFTRISTRDSIARGESTFMVEMIETANILNNATSRSLLILDEIGRGTSTFDGISIAWAAVEYLNGIAKRTHPSGETEVPLGPRTLFATHYFELTELAQTLSGVKNYNFAVREWGDKVIFLRKLMEGSADKSYGIHVAQLAGLPKEVLERAKEILYHLEKNSYREDGIPKLAKVEKEPSQLSLFAEAEHALLKELAEIKIEEMAPIEALNKLQELKEKIRKGGIAYGKGKEKV